MPGNDPFSPVREEKKRLRALLRERLKTVSPEEWRRLSGLLCRRLWEDRFYAEAETVFCFVGAAGEIDTRPFLERVLRDGKTLAVPLCAAGGCMSARIITGLGDLRPGFFGLPEPGRDAPVLPRERTDLAVLPCLGADRNAFRLGKGGGYYDRYLDGYPGRSLLVCPSLFLLPRVPREPFDMRADRLITDEEIKEPLFHPKGGPVR